MSFASKDNVSTSGHDTRIVTNKILTILTAGATPTLAAEADLTSFNSNGFTINWGTADATAREIAYLALRGLSSGSSASNHNSLMLLGVG